jgi:tetratricopeptide (TPR) repeat protein
LYRTHDTERARSLLKDALQLCRELGDTGHAGATLITLSLVEPDLNEAQTLADQGIAIFEDLYPQGHPNIGMAQARLGERLRYAGRFREAEVRLTRAVDPALHAAASELELAWLALGETLVNRGEAQRGLDFMSKAVDSRRTRLGEAAAPTLSASLRFAEQCLAAHLPARAHTLASSVLAQDPDNAPALRIEGLAFMAEGNLDASRDRLQRVLAACTALPSARAWEAGLVECDLADLMILRGQPDQARRYLESAMARDDRPSKVYAIGVRSRLALASLSPTPTERLRMLREACRVAAASPTARIPDLSECRVRLAEQLIATGSVAEAKDLLQQSKSDIADRLGTSHPRYQHVSELLNSAR